MASVASELSLFLREIKVCSCSNSDSWVFFWYLVLMMLISLILAWFYASRVLYFCYDIYFSFFRIWIWVYSSMILAIKLLISLFLSLTILFCYFSLWENYFCYVTGWIPSTQHTPYIYFISWLRCRLWFAFEGNCIFPSTFNVPPRVVRLDLSLSRNGNYTNFHSFLTAIEFYIIISKILKIINGRPRRSH